MANNFPPRVTVNNTDVQISQQFLIKNSLVVEDFDPDSEVVRYFFRDNDATLTSGYFIFKGVRVNPNIWFKVEESEINQLYYHAGLIESSETIGVQVFDGLFWSQAAFGVMTTTTLNDQRPNVTLQNFTVLSGEKVKFENFVSASDPNGDPIQFYRIVDRIGNANGGFFTVNGVKKTSGVFFDVAANQLQNVEYVGATFAHEERIGVFASDGKFLSLLAESTATTRANLHDPVVIAKNLNVQKGQSLLLSSMFSFSDADGSTLKRIRVLDTGSASFTGFFTINGVKIPANDFRWFEASDIPNIRYHSGSQGSLENYRLQVSDGSRLSTISTATLTTIVKPELEFDPVLRLNDFEFREFIDLVQEAPGLPVFRYEVIDLNDDPISADFVINGSKLSSQVVHTINGLDIEKLRIRGGSSADEGRKFDQLMFRAFNGTWGDWKRLDIDTTEIAGDAVLKFGSWPKVNLTYSFPNELPAQHAGGFAGEGFQPMNAAQRRAVREIYAHLESYTNLKFTEVSGSVGGDLELFTAALPGGILGVGFPPINLPNAVAGDFVITNTDPSVNNPVAGDMFYNVVIHELGHTMGLKHPDNQTGAGQPPLLPPQLQDTRYSTMISILFAPIGSSGTVFNRSFQLFDVMGLQKLYGKNMNYQTGNTQIRGEFQNDSRFMSIWDAGGNDTINRTQDTIDAIIDLRQGRYSSVGGEPRNIAINYGVEIEAARGGSGNDTLIGNELDNLLIGNAGDDIIRGHGGRDVMRGGSGNDTYQWGLGDDFNIIDEQGMGGTDTIEIITWGALDSFEKDIAFRRIGNDLRIDFNVDFGRSQGGFRIRNQALLGSRMETLRMVDLEGEEIAPSVDLTSVFVNATSVGQRFRITSTVGQFGNIAIPV